MKGINISEDGRQPHLVYKRSAVRGNLNLVSLTEQGVPQCGVEGEYSNVRSCSNILNEYDEIRVLSLHCLLSVCEDQHWVYYVDETWKMKKKKKRFLLSN